MDMFAERALFVLRLDKLQTWQPICLCAPEDCSFSSSAWRPPPHSTPAPRRMSPSWNPWVVCIRLQVQAVQTAWKWSVWIMACLVFYVFTYASLQWTRARYMWRFVMRRGWRRCENYLEVCMSSKQWWPSTPPPTVLQKASTGYYR